MNIIKKFEKLNLNEYPLKDIDDLLIKAENHAIMLTHLQQPENQQLPIMIERAVNNTKEEPVFSKTSRISFKPAKLNKSYLRASTPKNSMFYGSIISESDLLVNSPSDLGKIKDARIVSLSEISSLMRNSDVIEGWSRMTFGLWKIVEKISLATIIDPLAKYNEQYLCSIQDNYLNFLNQYSDEIKNNTLEYLKFLSKEFSKYVNSGNNHEYLISSKFTEHFVKKSSFDGVIYPSVQSKGYGLCVALHPRAIKKLELSSVTQGVLTKKIQKDPLSILSDYRLENEKFCWVSKGAENFELKHINR
jgi:hypothetical protein